MIRCEYFDFARITGAFISVTSHYRTVTLVTQGFVYFGGHFCRRFTRTHNAYAIAGIEFT